jgi:hypothetical protein
VNNRAARFCGPRTPEDRGPATPLIRTMTDGDFDTPEQQIGEAKSVGKKMARICQRKESRERRINEDV